MANAMYNNYKGKIGTIDWNDNSGITVKVMLVTSSYTLDVDAHLVKKDIDDLSVEVSGDGYTAGVL